MAKDQDQIPVSDKVGRLTLGESTNLGGTAVVMLGSRPNIWEGSFLIFDAWEER